MRFLIDRCAGTQIVEWLRSQGHDVVEARERGDDPGDLILLEWAAEESRILITIDTDFGQLILHEGAQAFWPNPIARCSFDKATANPG
jgi:predicted nuclease of predicted toxin-antitoxin system